MFVYMRTRSCEIAECERSASIRLLTRHGYHIVSAARRGRRHQRPRRLRPAPTRQWRDHRQGLVPASFSYTVGASAFLKAVSRESDLSAVGPVLRRRHLTLACRQSSNELFKVLVDKCLAGNIGSFLFTERLIRVTPERQPAQEPHLAAQEQHPR